MGSLYVSGSWGPEEESVELVLYRRLCFFVVLEQRPLLRRPLHPVAAAVLLSLIRYWTLFQRTCKRKLSGRVSIDVLF